MPLGIFGFQALWSPYFLFSVASLTAIYFLLTTKWRHKFKDSEPLTTKQASLFISTMIIVYIVKGSPVDIIGHILFSIHMIQMAILYLIVPPILIASIPTYLWSAFINLPVVKPIFHFFTLPLIALILFNGVFSFYHVPSIFDAIKTHETLHITYTIVLFVFAIFMWWPLVNKLPGQYQLSGVKKIGYVFADGILLTPACALIIFADHPLYASYADASVWLKAMSLCVPNGTLANLSLSGPELFTNMPVVEDQQLGGVVMKVIQEIVYGVMLFQVFFQWFKKEQEDSDAINEAALKAYQANSPRTVE
ncbi:cytochrome c oxidase assembly factor CtaG [Falsibacillus albus]|uniref:Cytochrome c oxidase assembly factor CtaG n=1 Tax=Falsibacillus albus TaxID=2478915 RepID=A0A3L7JYI5_9BACI|nr:cytochrome c oxidase assembly factor CtaG [Falsibacillus albus]RLQ95867.1 cytochrome c oxidase assembly factor CtaG [Falsibacillus albus]